MPKLRRWIIVGCVNLILAAVLIEVGANLYFALSHGAFFYTAARDQQPSATIPAMYQTRQVVFHPYVGYVNHPDRNDDPVFGVNNHGFQVHRSLLAADPRCCDYPLARRPGEALVGIFGGSVGLGFSGYAQGDPEFVQLLQQLPRFTGKKIRILNFALSGFRQPQQALTLAYYLSLGQQFDLVINIDGFNEVVNSVMNWSRGDEPTYPPDAIWGAMGRAEEQGKIASSSDDLLAAWHERAAAAAARSADRECRIATCYLVERMSERWHLLRHRQLADIAKRETDDATWFLAKHRYTFGTDIDLAEYTADRWRDSSILMAAMLRQKGIPYLHVLQPNQWFPSASGYQPLKADHPYKWVIEPVNRFYPAFQRRSRDLTEARVAFLDATRVFENKDARTIFIDDCCHYTAEGYRILFHEIAAFLADRAVLAGPAIQPSAGDAAAKSHGSLQ